MIEILITMGVIGVMAAIGFPSLMRFVPDYELKAAARELQANFQKAKLHAVKRNRDVTFNFTINGTCSGPSSYTFTDEDGVVVVTKTFDGKKSCILSSTFVNGSSGFDAKGISLPIPTPPPPVFPLTVLMGHRKIVRQFTIAQSVAGSIRIQ